ncbi:MAG TPA: hypothetical protein ACFYD3_04700 [Candidatus Hypogeohydataceae bacterium YC41]
MGKEREGKKEQLSPEMLRLAREIADEVAKKIALKPRFGISIMCPVDFTCGHQYAACKAFTHSCPSTYSCPGMVLNPDPCGKNFSCGNFSCSEPYTCSGIFKF